jgi:hypothetical protein
MVNRNIRLFPVALMAVAFLGAACSGNDKEAAKQPEPVKVTDGRNGGLIEQFLGGGRSGRGSGDASIAVNSYLWRASLDTVSFLPLNTADPFGGIIITDWYSPPATPEERFKVTVYILDRDLRADGLRVSVFRQTRDPGSGWIEAKVDERTGRDLENAILKRARQMRIRVNQR